MNKLICRLALVMAATSLAGCGLKGPLYFPKDETTPQQTRTTAGEAAGSSQAAASPGQSVPAAR